MGTCIRAKDKGQAKLNINFWFFVLVKAIATEGMPYLFLPCRIASLASLIVRIWIHAEAMLSIGGVHDDGGVLILGRNAGVDHLAQDVAGGLALLGFVFQLVQPGPKLSELCELALGLSLLEEGPLLVVLDLSLGSPPLRARLEHVGRDALGH